MPSHELIARNDFHAASLVDFVGGEYESRPEHAKTKPQRPRLSRVAVFCWGLLTLALVIAWPQTVGGWQTASEAIEVTFSDPLEKYQTVHGFRPITVTIATVSGKPAEQTQTYWLVQRLLAPYWKHPLERKKFLKFTLPAGQQQVTVHFIAECPNAGYSTEELFIEQDGNLKARFNGVMGASDARDFWLSSRDYQSPSDVGLLNILHCRSHSSHLNTNTKRYLVDFKAQQLVPQQQIQLPLPPLNPEETTPPLSLAGSLEILLEIMNGFTGNAQTPATAPPPKYTNGFQFIEEQHWFAACTPAQMPESWIGLINVELLLISQQDLNGLSRLQREAVAKWVAAGGRLSVTDCLESGAGVSQLPDQLLGSESASGQQMRPPVWYALPETEELPPLKSEQLLLPSEEYFPAAVVLSGNSFKAQTVKGSPEGNPGDFFFFDQLLGRVVATSRKLEQFQKADWRRLIATAWGRGRRDRVQANLGDYSLAGARISSFVIEGVGEPPRLLFLSLITLFALTVGPLAYTVLYRSRRTNYLLFVVPLVSALTTLGLLLYAILADGFQFRAQRFSYSRLDQNSQQAVTLTRHSVFSGTSPQRYIANRDELLMPAPPEGRDLQQFEDLGAKRRFVASWLRARTPHQMAVASIRTATERLQISRQDVGGETQVVVSNQLGTPIFGALLRFEDKWFEVGPLAAGESAKAKPTEPESFLNTIRPQLAPTVLLENGNINTGYSRPAEYGDFGLTELLTKPELFGPSFIAPGQYIAVLPDYDGAGQLKDNVRYQKQLHIIHGNW